MIQLAAIFAQADYAKRLRGLSGAFQSNEGGPSELRQILGFFAMVAAIIVGMLLARAIWRRRGDKCVGQKPAKLFAYILKQLGIRLPDRVLLRCAARNCDLKHPAMMLMSPQLLERSAGRWADSITVKPVREHVRRRIAALADKAFPQDVALDEEESGQAGSAT